MTKTLRLTGIAAALTAWLVATGLAWDGLQLAAWANMARINARTMTTEAAVQAAVTGAPCKHCIAVRAGRADTERSVPASVQLGKSIADLPLPSTTAFAFLAPSETWPRPTNTEAPPRTAEVDVPPPRRRAA